MEKKSQTYWKIEIQPSNGKDKTENNAYVCDNQTRQNIISILFLSFFTQKKL